MTQVIPGAWQPDLRRAFRWRTVRKKIRTRNEHERKLLLHNLEEEVRTLASVAAGALMTEWEQTDYQELNTPLGILVGAWLNAEPVNPAWPSRDRLFLARPHDLIAACSALALAGFFPPEHVANIVDKVMMGGGQVKIPGIEAVAAPFENQVAMAWESALESGRNKRRWQEFFTVGPEPSWAEPAWRNDSSLWRTYIIADANDEAITAFRDLGEDLIEAPAGLVALLVVNREGIASTKQQLQEIGWDVTVVEKSDYMGLYKALTLPSGDFPLAVLLDMGRERLTPSGRFSERLDAAKLLGELSDEQFNAIMGESLDS